MEKARRFDGILLKTSSSYDILFKETNINKFERGIINFALVGFLAHLLLIFIARQFSLGQTFLAQMPTNYVKAIYTPFSIILFYEVLTLVLILPQSISIFIGKQYEIITLIAIRSFFHDISEYDLEKPDIYTFEFLKTIGIDLIGALLMFLFTILYYRAFAKTRKNSKDPSSRRMRFILIKKTAAVILTGLLILLSIISFGNWLKESIEAIRSGSQLPNPNVVFYKDFFSVMIFVDVFLLILSFIYSSTYELIFRNAGFVISTILVRIALTAPKPFNIYFSLTAIFFGVLLITFFVFFMQIIKNENGIKITDAE